MENLHIRLKEEIDRLGLSMAETARQMGESDSQELRDVCSGRKRASAALVAKIAISEIGADVLYILTGQRGAPPALSREEECFLDNWRHSPKDAQESMKTMCAALAKRPAKKRTTGANG